MAGRSYNQYCAVARGLDLIGDRWTLLIVRDLLLGPKRYKDLLDGLPGIGTNLLATRLHELTRDGLVERALLPPPAGSAVYQLTESGQALEPVVIAIGRFGGRFLGLPLAADVLLPSAYFVAIRAAFRPQLAQGVAETYEFRVGGRVFEVRVGEGRCETREGGAVHPSVVATMDVETLNALLLGGLPPARGLADGLISMSGDPAALDRFALSFAIHPGTT